MVGHLPSDVDADGLVNALVEEIGQRGLASQSPFADEVMEVQRRAFGTALVAVHEGADPVARLDVFAAGRGDRGERAEALREVRARVVELVGEHRHAYPPVPLSNEASALDGLADMRRQPQDASAQAAYSSFSSSSSDYVASYLEESSRVGADAPTATFDVHVADESDPRLANQRLLDVPGDNPGPPPSVATTRWQRLSTAASMASASAVR